MEPNIAYISSRQCHRRDVTGDPVSNHGDAGEMVSVVNYIIKALRIDIQCPICYFIHYPDVVSFSLS